MDGATGDGNDGAENDVCAGVGGGDVDGVGVAAGAEREADGDGAEDGESQ